jgi:uncharacterized protein
MTPQEHDLLKGLTDRVNQTQLTDKDPEAEQFIFQNLGKNSDSLYIMAQTILVQQYALDNAKKQLDDLNQQLTERNQQLEQLQQQQAQQPVKHTSFLGSLLGNDNAPAQPAPPPPPPQQYGQAQYQPVPNYAPPQTYAQPVQYAQPVTYAQPTAYGAPQIGGMMGGMMGGGGSSFLRSAATTAAGVAAGAIAFEGIESLMHGFEHHAGYGGGDYGGGGFNSGPREEIINNYYGDSDRGSEHHDQGRDLTDRFADAGDTPSPDIEDRRDDTRSFAGSDIPADDTTNFDSSADNFTDDSSSFDSGGGFDSGGSDDSNS